MFPEVWPGPGADRGPIFTGEGPGYLGRKIVDGPHPDTVLNPKVLVRSISYLVVSTLYWVLSFLHSRNYGSIVRAHPFVTGALSI